MLTAYRRLLSNGPLMRLLVGEFVSSIGDWLYLVALLIVVYERSQSAALLGLVGAARVAPYILLSVPAGYVADRFERRKVLLVTDIARGVLMLLLAWIVAVDGPLVTIVVLALLAACFSTFFGPTLGSYLPQLVTDETELGPTNSAWASLDNLAFVIGPAIGGLLIAGSGLAVAFLINAASFGVIATVLWGLPHDKRRSAAEGGPTVEVASTLAAPARAGVRDAIRPLAGLATIDSAGRFVMGGLSILTVILATRTLGAGEEGTGYLNAAIGVGGLVGAVASGILVLRRDMAAPLVVGAVLFAIGLAGLGAAPGLALAAVAMAVASGGALLVEVVGTTLLQRVVPDEVRGRALGAIATVGVLAYALGSLVIPILADQLGAALVLAGGAVVLLAAVFAGLVLLGRTVSQEPSSLAPLMLRVAGLPLFAGVPAERLEAAVRRLRELPVKTGDVIIRQGDPADRFYIIVSGSFAVTQVPPAGGDERLLRTMRPDEVFGEIGLLTGAGRTATVTAESDGLLAALDGPAFLELVGVETELSARMLELHGSGLAATAR
jgi:MFS family permease